MARPRNEEMKQAIERASWALFRERGYDATSYTAVAEECGISRNLAQYYFPKKELLAISFMERLLSEAQKGLGISDGELYNDCARIYEVGVCYFVFLLRGDGYRTFLFDIIKSRDLTEGILSFNAKWALGRVEAPADTLDEQGEVMRSIIVHMGGFYELLYHCLKSDLTFDVSLELSRVMRAFMEALGYPEAQVQESISPEQIDLAAISSAIGMADKVFSEK